MGGLPDLYYIECRVCFGNVGDVGLPPKFLYFTFIIQTLGATLHTLHFFFSTFFYFLKYIINNK